MTLASSVCVSPVALSRHVTALATVSPPSVAVLILVTKASVTSVTALPPVFHASAVSAIGT